MNNTKATYRDIAFMIDVTRDLVRTYKAPTPRAGIVAFVAQATPEDAKQKIVAQITSLSLPADKQAKALELLRENKFATLASYLKPLAQ